jgi:WD40 repeat protein
MIGASEALLVCPQGHRFDLGASKPFSEEDGNLACPKCGGSLLAQVHLSGFRDRTWRIVAVIIGVICIIGLVIASIVTRACGTDVHLFGFTPSGRAVIVSGGPSQVVNEIRALDVQTGMPGGWIKVNSAVDAFVLLPDGITAAVAGRNTSDSDVGTGVVSVWDFQQHQERAKLPSTGAPIAIMTFLPDEHALLTVTGKGTLTWYDPDTLKVKKSLKLADSFTRAALSRDGKTLAVGDRFIAKVTLYDTTTGQFLWQTTIGNNPTQALAFAPDGHSIAVVSQMESKVVFLNTAGGGVLTALNVPLDWLTCVAYSPDGAYLAIGGGNYRQHGAVKVYDRGTMTEKHSLEIATNTVTSLAVAPDGTRLAAGSSPPINLVASRRRGQWHQWDLATGKLLASGD